MSPRSGWRFITETRAEAGRFCWKFFRISDREIHADLDAHGFLADESPTENDLFLQGFTMLLGFGGFHRLLNRGGLQHGAADLGSWPALWLARFFPTSQRSGLVVGRPRLWRHRLWQSWFRWPWFFPIRLRELRPLRRWLWQRLFPLRLWERGLLRRIRSCPSCVSRGGEARLCCEAGRIWRHQ